MLQKKAEKIKLIIFDVDGVMTDGSIYHSSKGDEIKAFNVQDGLGIKLLQKAGILTAIITGRKSELVATRAAELDFDDVYQGQKNKQAAYDELLANYQLQPEQVAYMGDDLPDLKFIKESGLGVAVENAADDVKKYADYITKIPGGKGAIREVAEYILKAQNHWSQLLESYL